MPQLQPTLTTPRDPAREMIPGVLLYAMAALALATLIVTGFAVATDRAKVGTPAAGIAVQERFLTLEGKSAQAVIVKDTDGTVLMDMAHGGFITVIQSAMARARTVARVQGNPPMRIVRYDNGRLVAEDPATGWSAELYAFGQDNKAAFERLLDDTKE